MSLPERIELIQQFSLFTDVSLQEITVLAENAKERLFEPHTVILSPNNQPDGIYLMDRGLLQVYINTAEGKLIPISIKPPPYIASEINILEEETNVSMQTLQQTHVLSLSKNDCKKIVMNHPPVMVHLFKMVVKKLHVVNEQIERYYSLSLKSRTIHSLTELASYFPNRTIPLSHEEIATIVGATRARVTEVLNELRDEKVIHLEYRKILVN